MTLKQNILHFLDFVEIRTKLATIFPFLVALSYVFYQQGYINKRSTLLYIVAALIVDMAITGTNQHFDARQEEESTPHYSTLVSGSILVGMYTVASLIGLYLASLHGLPVLFAGMLCFFIGLIYTFGPMPISKSVFGEVFAGFTAGFLIMFIVTSINSVSFLPVFIYLDLTHYTASVYVEFLTLIGFGIITLPAVFSSANILLANNICDREKDRKYRYTLTHHIGLKNALIVFAGLYYASYLSIVVAVLFGILPVITLVTLLTIVPVQKNIRTFFNVHVKSETFILSVQNYTLILVTMAGCLFVAGVMRWWL